MAVRRTLAWTAWHQPQHRPSTGTLFLLMCILIQASSTVDTAAIPATNQSIEDSTGFLNSEYTAGEWKKPEVHMDPKESPDQGTVASGNLHKVSTSSDFGGSWTETTTGVSPSQAHVTNYILKSPTLDKDKVCSALCPIGEGGSYCNCDQPVLP